jgi:hypothetical protein
VRYEPDGTRESKTFRPYCFRTFEGGVKKWSTGAPDLRPLYRLPEIALTSTVVLVEGEGCAEALAQLGIEATSAMQGANAPIDKTDWSPLAGKKIIIWPDNDAPGIAYARTVAQRLISLGCTVLGITPPSDASEGWDAVDAIAEGRSVQDIVAAATPVNAAPAPERSRNFKLLSLSEIGSLAPPSWLIANILTEGGLSMMWGRSGSMKSFVALDMALCIAAGKDWHGHKVKQGTVVYIAAEGSHGLGRRAVGWFQSKKEELKGREPPFRLLPHSLVMTSDELKLLIDAVLALKVMPVLIVIDTLARTFGGGDENKQADMNAYVTAADKLREATGANVMIVHHSGVHEDRRERGSNVLRGAADTVIKISRKDNKIDVINRAPEGKQKDAEEFETVKLRTQKVGDDDASTLVLVARDDADLLGNEPVEEGESGGKVKLGKVEQAVLAALQKAGEPLGLMRVTAMTSGHRGSVKRSLDTLVEKGLALVEDDKSGNSQLWRLTNAT